MNTTKSGKGKRAIWAVTLTGIAACAAMLQTGISAAAEIKVLSAAAIKPSLEELAPLFEKTTNHKLAIKFMGGSAIAKGLQGPADADIVILPRSNADTLVKSGKVSEANVSPLASSLIGVAVRKGAARPDLSTPDAFKRALLSAKSIAYNNPETSGSGRHVAKVLEQLGIAKDVSAKIVVAEPGGGALGTFVAEGKAELGITTLSTYVGVAGVDVVGPIPKELQLSTVYAAAIVTGTKNTDAVKALVTFLRGAQAAKVYRSKGMEPG